MALKPIEIFIDTISSVAHRINISSVVSLGSNQYRLNTNNTLYLRPLKKVLIDGVEYVVDDFEINSYITVSATDGSDTPVTVDFFDIDAPLFLFGNPKMVSGELIKRINNGNGSWPYIWLVEISNTSGTLDPAAAVTQTPSFNLFFLDSNDYENWSIQQHYDNDIYVMSNYINFVLSILKSRRDVYETDSITYTTTNHVNFGDYIVDEGMNERILNDNVTGVQLQVDLPIIIQTCKDVSITANCPIITETFNGASISSPVSFKNIVVQTNDAIPVERGNILIDTSQSLVIQVASGAVTSLDISVNGTLLIPAATTNQDIIVFTEGSGAQVGTPDGGEWQILDSIVSNSDDTYSVTLEAQDTLELPDITHTQTDGSPEILPAQTALVCDPAADAANQVNGASKTAIPSGGSKNFVIQDPSGSPVSVTDVSDDEDEYIGEVPAPPLNTSNLRKTFLLASLRTGDDGATQRGRGVSWYKTDYNNLWGHAFRFCGTTGGYTDGVSYFDVSGVATTRALAFPNNEMSDWAYWNQINGKVMMWYLLPFGTTTPVPALPNGGTVSGKSVNNAIDEALASTQNGRSDWYCPNIEELNSIIYREQAINAGDALNYPPFDYAYNGSFPSSTGWRIVSSSSKGVRAMYLIITNGITAPISLTNTLYSYFIIREADITTDFGL